MTFLLQPRQRYPFGGDPASEAGRAGHTGAATKENVGMPGGVNEAGGGGGCSRGAPPLPDPRRLVAVLQEMSSRKRERSRRVSKLARTVIYIMENIPVITECYNR